MERKGNIQGGNTRVFKQNLPSTSVAQQNHNFPMYDMPSSMDHTSEPQPLEQVSNIKQILAILC
jgi:hypothetical protein